MSDQPVDIQDRVIEMRRVRGRDLVDHPLQDREHDQAQIDALDAILQEVGIAGVLLAYQSAETGALTTINGHMRKNSHPDLEWPTLILDVSDEEARTLLAFYDALSARASYNPGHTQRLLAQVKTRNPIIAAWQMQRAEEAAQAALTRSALSRDGSAQHRTKLNERSTAVRVILYAPEIRTVEAAIRRAGAADAFPNRGEALVRICQFYLDHTPDAASSEG